MTSPKVCNLFFECRPYDCGQNYTPPAGGVSGGDPHYVTFDGVKYDFQGYGEYWLFKSNIANIQVRQNPNELNKDKVTWFKGIHFGCQGTSFQIAHDVRSAYNNTLLMHLHHNGHHFPLMSGVDAAVLGKGMTVGTGPRVQTPTRDLVSFKITCGKVTGSFEVGVELYDEHYLKYIDVKIQAQCNDEDVGKISGLLGNCNGDPEDDFIPPGQDTPVLKSSASWLEIYNKFGEPWRVTKNESGFQYQEWESYESYNKIPDDFKPLVDPPIPKDFPQEIQDVCKDNMACYVDYQMTGSIEIGAGAKENEDRKEQEDEILNQPPGFCNQLPAIENGYYQPKQDIYYIGDRVHVHCDESFKLIGVRTMVCPLDSQWPSTPVAACYPDEDDEENDAPPDFLSGALGDLYELIAKYHGDNVYSDLPIEETIK